MMLPHDVTDHAEAKRPDSTEPYRPGGILLFGYLRKLKVNCLSLPINHISFCSAVLNSGLLFFLHLTAHEKKILHTNS